MAPQPVFKDLVHDVIARLSILHRFRSYSWRSVRLAPGMAFTASGYDERSAAEMWTRTMDMWRRSTLIFRALLAYHAALTAHCTWSQVVVTSCLVCTRSTATRRRQRAGAPRASRGRRRELFERAIGPACHGSSRDEHAVLPVAVASAASLSSE